MLNLLYMGFEFKIADILQLSGSTEHLEVVKNGKLFFIELFFFYFVIAVVLCFCLASAQLQDDKIKRLTSPLTRSCWYQSVSEKIIKIFHMVQGLWPFSYFNPCPAE